MSVVTGLLWTAMAVVFSRAVSQSRGLLRVLQISGVVALAGTVMLVVRWGPLWTGQVAGLPLLTTTQVGAGVLTALGFFAMRRAMDRGPHGLVWTVSQSALVMPLLFSVLWFGHHLRQGALVGAGLVVVSLVLLGRVREFQERSSAGRLTGWLGWAVTCMALFGAAQILATLPSQWPGWRDDAALRPGLYAAGTLGCYLLAELKARRPKDASTAAMVPGILHGVLTIASLLCIYAALDALGEVQRAGLMYPITVAVSVVSFMAYTVIVRGERPGLYGYVGAGLAAVGTVLMALA